MKIGTKHGALNLNLDAPVVISVQWHQYDNMSFSVFDAQSQDQTDPKVIHTFVK